MKLICKALWTAPVTGITQFLPATHTFIHKWNEPSCFYSQPQSITTLWPVLLRVLWQEAELV